MIVRRTQVEAERDFAAFESHFLFLSFFFWWSLTVLTLNTCLKVTPLDNSQIQIGWIHHASEMGGPRWSVRVKSRPDRAVYRTMPLTKPRWADDTYKFICGHESCENWYWSSKSDIMFSSSKHAPLAWLYCRSGTLHWYWSACTEPRGRRHLQLMYFRITSGKCIFKRVPCLPLIIKENSNRQSLLIRNGNLGMELITLRQSKLHGVAQMTHVGQKCGIWMIHHQSRLNWFDDSVSSRRLAQCSEHYLGKHTNCWLP